MKDTNKDNKVPKAVFLPDKWSRRITVFLIIVIDILICYFTFTKGQLFNAELLKSLSEFSITIILAIVALGITVLQSDKKLIGGNSEENKREIYIRYVFSIFPTIVIVILGFVVAVVFEEHDFLIRSYSLIMVLMMSKSITGTMASFVAFLNIKD